MSKLGPNVLAGGNFDAERLKAFIIGIKAPFTLVMNNASFARELVGITKPIYRRWPDDNYSHQEDPTARMLSMAQDTGFDPGVLLYNQNEPSQDATCHEWDADCVVATEALGVGVVVNNSGFGGPQQNEIESPKFLELLRVIAYSNERRRAAGIELAYLGLHEYAQYHDWRFDNLDGHLDLPPVSYDPLTGNNWLIARYLKILEVCDKFGIEHPPIIITEHGYDGYTQWDHGWNAAEQVPEETYAQDLLDMQVQVYNRDEIKGVLIFTWASDDGNWTTFDIREAYAFQNYLIEHTEETQVSVTVHTTVSKRDDASLTGTKLGNFEAGSYPYLEFSELITSDGYYWRKFSDGTDTWYSAVGVTAGGYISVVGDATLSLEVPDPTDWESAIDAVNASIAAVQSEVDALWEVVGDMSTTADEVRINRLEAVMQEVINKMKTIATSIVGWASEAQDEFNDYDPFE